MILIVHILIAISSVAYTTYLFFAPTRSKLNISYGLAAATMLSGTYLVASLGTHILESCVIGMFYLGVVSAAVIYVRRELAADKVKSRKRNL